MIFETLDFVRAKLDFRLKEAFPTDGSWVAMTPMSNSDGSVPTEAVNKVILSLVNLERDPVASGTAPMRRSEGGETAVMQPSLALNLDVLVSAHFDEHYGDGLKLLSASVGFFQASPLFTPDSAPDLPEGMTRLSVEWMDMNLQEIHNLWTVLGGRYLPSVLYKMRTITVQEQWITREVPIVTGINLE